MVVRNDDYWGGKPKWEKVTIRPIKSGPSRVAALLAGDVDLIEEVPTTDIERLKKDAKVELSQGVSNRVIYLHLDHWRDETPFVTANDGSGDQEPAEGRARAQGDVEGDQPRTRSSSGVMERRRDPGGAVPARRASSASRRT